MGPPVPFRSLSRPGVSRGAIGLATKRMPGRGGASRDGVGLLTPALLLRPEGRHCARSERGFRPGRIAEARRCRRRASARPPGGRLADCCSGRRGAARASRLGGASGGVVADSGGVADLSGSGHGAGRSRSQIAAPPHGEQQSSDRPLGRIPDHGRSHTKRNRGCVRYATRAAAQSLCPQAAHHKVQLRSWR